MITAVLDTNVLASGFTIRGGPSDQLLRRWGRRVFQLAVSEPILTELTRTLERRYFRERLNPNQRTGIIALLRRSATLTAITVTIQAVATHPEDDLILATAVSAQADYLVTGDKKLQQLGSYQGVTVLSPRAFLDLLQAHPPEETPPDQN